MRNILLSILFLFYFLPIFCEGYMFRIELKDKGNPPFTIENPLEYLSEKSIERRERQGIPVDSTDLPIDPLYLEEIRFTGASITAISKWVKTVTVYLPDLSLVPELKNLDFVDTLYCVWKGNSLPGYSTQEKFVKTESSTPSLKTEMSSYTQVSMLKVDLLHQAGFKGKDMSIAVIDAGFLDADQIPAWDFNQVKEVKNFTYESGDPLRITQAHGTQVLSCMLSNLFGTAPEADYYLFQSEVNESEYPVEEDYWVAAVEYADSIGIDILNTSLGYTLFDDPSMNHVYEQFDGKTIPASKAASMAGNKGMLLFISAGNEGTKPWKKISVPNDADNIITVGSVNAGSVIAASSSQGPTADGRVKPDLCAMGVNATIISYGGIVTNGSGTSYASPILAGAGACLWQALPHKTSKEIIALMKSAGDRFATPNFVYGYGIPDVNKVYLENVLNVTEISINRKSLLFFDATTNCLYMENSDLEKISLQIFNSQGQLIFHDNDVAMQVDLNNLNQGVYITHVRQGEKQAVQKFVKW